MSLILESGVGTGKTIMAIYMTYRFKLKTLIAMK